MKNNFVDLTSDVIISTSLDTEHYNYLNTTVFFNTIPILEATYSGNFNDLTSELVMSSSVDNEYYKVLNTTAHFYITPILEATYKNTTVNLIEEVRMFTAFDNSVLPEVKRPIVSVPLDEYCGEITLRVTNTNNFTVALSINNVSYGNLLANEWKDYDVHNVDGQLFTTVVKFTAYGEESTQGVTSVTANV